VGARAGAHAAIGGARACRLQPLPGRTLTVPRPFAPHPQLQAAPGAARLRAGHARAAADRQRGVLDQRLASSGATGDGAVCAWDARLPGRWHMHVCAHCCERAWRGHCRCRLQQHARPASVRVRAHVCPTHHACLWPRGRHRQDELPARHAQVHRHQGGRQPSSVCMLTSKACTALAPPHNTNRRRGTTTQHTPGGLQRTRRSST
jgi:hypothetical protein